MEENPKPFWSTLPGILTGIASVITALVSLIAALNNLKPAVPKAAIAQTAPAAPPGAGVQNTPVIMVTNTPSAPGKTTGCEKALGNWDWFIGGVVTFEKDGHLAWRKNATDLIPTATGSWNCVNLKNQEMTLYWNPTGMVDTVSLSADGKSIEGTNYTGIKITGTKRLR